MYKSEAMRVKQVAMQCRLWRALAEHALKDRNFDLTERCFVRCAEYQVMLCNSKFNTQLHCALQGCATK